MKSKEVDNKINMNSLKNELNVLNADLAFDFGELCFNERSDESCAESAVVFFQMAADRGHKMAKGKLGLCYLEGIGVKQDKEKGFELAKEGFHQSIDEFKSDFQKFILAAEKQPAKPNPSHSSQNRSSR